MCLILNLESREVLAALVLVAANEEKVRFNTTNLD